MAQIKCDNVNCEYSNKRAKAGCKRQADPHTCKGYLMTIITMLEETVIEQAAKIKELEDWWKP